VGKTKSSASASALAALWKTAGSNPLQKGKCQSLEANSDISDLDKHLHIGHAIGALPASGSFSSVASNNGAAHPDKAAGKRHGGMRTGSRNYLETRGMEMLH